MHTALGTPLTTVPPLELPEAQLPATVVTVDEVKRELMVMRRELATQRREREELLSDTPLQRAHARLQGAAAWVRRTEINSGAACFTLGVVGGMLGAVAGLCTAIVANSDAVGLAVFTGVAAASVTISPLAAGLALLADKARAAPPVKMIELADLERPLKRFDLASGVTKAHIADGLANTRGSLEAQELLSPEARAALVRVASEAARLDGPAVARQRPLTQLARLLEEPIDPALVDNARRALAQVPVSERAQVAQALSELVFEDRKRVARASYAARNSLHDLLQSHATRPEATDKRPS